MEIDIDELIELIRECEFDDQWPPFYTYLETVSSLLIEDRETVISTVVSQANTPDEVMGIFDYRWCKFEDVFRKSFLITLCASFEAFLVDMCALQKEKGGEDFIFGQNNRIQKAVEYLRRGGVVSIDGKTRETLREFSEIRNLIVHCDACLENYKKESSRGVSRRSWLKGIVERTNGLAWIESRFCSSVLVVEDEYCYQILDVVEQLGRKVYYEVT